LQSVLIVSRSDKGTEFFAAILKETGFTAVSLCDSCKKAERLLSRGFDLVIIDAPLGDNSGETFAKQTAKSGNRVILAIKSEAFDDIAADCSEHGVFTVAKPLRRDVFLNAIMFVKTAHKLIMTENAELRRKIEDIRIVDRAKCLLISYMNISEKEAHRHIEKQAMDLRSTKREVAENILRTYEN